MNTCLQALRDSFNYEGRMSRNNFWVFYFSGFLILFAVSLLMLISQYFIVAVIVTALVFTVASLAAQVRRLHDINKSGFFIFLSFIPVLGFIALLVMLCLPSVHKNNKYGPKDLTPTQRKQQLLEALETVMVKQQQQKKAAEAEAVAQNRPPETANKTTEEVEEKKAFKPDIEAESMFYQKHHLAKREELPPKEILNQFPQAEIKEIIILSNTFKHNLSTGMNATSIEKALLKKGYSPENIAYGLSLFKKVKALA